MKSLTLLQITDCHLHASDERTLLGIRTNDSFAAVVAQIQNDFGDKLVQQVDALLLTGDLTQEAKPETLQHLISGLQPLQVPYYCLPGNHDLSELMQQCLPVESLQTKIDLNVQWVLHQLDTHQDHKVEGFFSLDAIAQLEETIGQQPDKHHLLACHHHPVSINSAWLDQQVIDNGQALVDLIERMPQIKLLVQGHIHQDLDKVLNDGTRWLASPSTCFQFTPDSDDFALDFDMPPGYRLIQLHDDGRIETSVYRVQNWTQKPSTSAKGY